MSAAADLGRLSGVSATEWVRCTRSGEVSVVDGVEAVPPTLAVRRDADAALLALVALAVGVGAVMALANLWPVLTPLLLLVWAVAAAVQVYSGLLLPRGWVLLPGALLQLVGALAGLQIASGASDLLARIDPFSFFNLLGPGLLLSVISFGVITLRRFRGGAR
ncbi:hypothetical protein [Corynebacterium guangdongense]|uniref:Uncharacterized protein n=1 Tax=Corynebacterium guangdongense TaxID=1783348 RepID=A0ABU1ZUB7_9CORY|nr:hypothetical protein [Corynebacterium guangdongense]MDR7328523.1 hypothetical protein [Corynebacterium guangdongense]WJZ17100.1 hypothetical protein CGUA_02520 [Corynebacterium guangdongense]